LKKEENSWMKQVMTIVRNTSLYFAPQIRTKIMNEGWASYWHDRLFISDERIHGHEANYARINAGVTSISRIGLNPYAIGLRLFEYIEELSNKGKMSFEYQKLTNQEEKLNFDKDTKQGKDTIFDIRKTFSDFSFVHTFIDQPFMEKHNLFVTGKRYNEDNNLIEYYIKSRKANDYKEMLIESMYHPPVIRVNQEKTTESNLYLEHEFEGKQLVKDFVPDVLVGIEYLWGNKVQLETTEILRTKDEENEGEVKLVQRRVLYSCKNKQVSKVEV
jgi:stage V sporulation protein R